MNFAKLARILLIGSTCLLAWVDLTYAQSDGPKGVPLRIWAAGYGKTAPSGDPANIILDGTGFLETYPGSGVGGHLHAAAGRYGSSPAWYYTTKSTLQAEPGRTYSISVHGLNNDKNALYIVPPPGFAVEMDSVECTRLEETGGNHTYVVRVIAPMEDVSGRAGAAASITNGRDLWQVALGSLQDGRPAGSMAVMDVGDASTWSTLFTPAALQYAEPSSEIYVVRLSNVIRQVFADEAVVDVYVPSGSTTSYELRFYDPNDVDSIDPGTHIATFKSGKYPYVKYVVSEGGTATTLVITSIAMNTGTGATIRTAKTTLTRTGTWPSFTWNLQDWNTDSTTQLVQDVRNFGGVTSARTESAAVSVPSGATATQTSRTYAQHDWGESVASETLGTSESIATTFDYYADSGQPGSYAYLKSASTSNGSWQAYEYYDAAVDSTCTGTIKYRYQPYLAAPSSITFDPDQGLATYFEYNLDPFGMLTRPTLIQTTIGGTTVSKSAVAYTEATLTMGSNAYYVVTATSKEYPNSGTYLQTITKYFREDTYDEFFRSEIHSIQRPNGAKQSFAYQRGTWSSGTFTKSSNNGTDPGPNSRIVTITGVSGSGLTTYDGYDIDDLDLVDGKSTLDITIRDARAHVVHTETQGWKTGAWHLVTSADYSYDAAGNLTNKTANNGGLYEAVFSGEQKISEKDESGVQVSYVYDNAGRVSTATKTSGPVTTFTYDAASHQVSETISATGTGETIYSNRSYDDAGRIKTELPVGMTTVNHDYDVAGRTHTITYPDGGTRVEHAYPDGRTLQVDGSSVVPVYYSYTVETDGRFTTVVHSGASNSPRTQQNTVDWLGRTLHSERPGFSVTSQAAYQEDNTYDPGTGYLTKTTRSGYAPTLYAYDVLGNVTRSGLDLNNDGSLVLASGDRITDGDQFFEIDGSGYTWLRQETKTYPKDSDATAITTAVTRKRLTGYPTNRLDEVQAIDIEGNTVTRTVDVNRTAATLTVTTTRPGVANTQVETIANGLSTSFTGHDGLTTSTQYDSLSRSWKMTDPRSNVTTTTYKYGTTLVQSVADGAGNTLGTVSYDGMARKQYVQDAASQYTRFSYNQRGQLTNQWGGGSYPVSYVYDGTYGDQTTLNTYRGAPSGDSGSWPSVGTADTTTWTFDGASGLLWKKTDAGSQVTEFDYNVRGQTASRKWARHLTTTGLTGTPVTTSYVYDSSTGELTNVNYNDDLEAIPTTDLVYHYTRAGQVDSVTDNTGVRAFGYDTSLPWRLKTETLSSGFYASRILTRNYDETSGTGGYFPPHPSYAVGTVKGRYNGYDLGVSGNTARDQHVSYTNSDLGRFVGVDTRVTVGSALDYVYNYFPSTALVGGYGVGSNFSVTRGYEPHRDMLTSIESKWSSTSLTSYTYAYNGLGQRTTAGQSGTAFGDYTQSGLGYSSTYRVYNYNARGELQTAAMYGGDTPTSSPPAGAELPGRRFEYRYDSIGNRITSGSTGTSSDDEYARNALNQYTQKKNKSVKVLGVADAGATVAVSGTTSTGKTDRAWGADLAPANSGGPVQGTANVYAALPGGGSGGADLVRTDSRSYFIPKFAQDMAYDVDGNLTNDGVWIYTYNAENQLVRMTSLLGSGFAGMNLQIDFRYDYQGRRVQKRVYDLTASTEISLRKYLYDGWNLIAETDDASNLKRVFTWGLDLAGSLSATGGVGALLQIDDFGAGKTLTPTYDGNGNIAALVNLSSGAPEATYEYDPSGNLLRCEGAYAKSNPFRFSTKWQDDETGLVNYGFRYYSPALGRFINRDPIAEKGGLNLYGFCGNDGINGLDYLGLDPVMMEPFIVYGAQIGSSFGPIGTVVGAVLGGVVGFFAETGIFGGLFGGAHAPPPKPKSLARKPPRNSDYSHLLEKWRYTDLGDDMWVETGTMEGGTLPAVNVTASRLPSFTSQLLAAINAANPAMVLSRIARGMADQYRHNLQLGGGHFNAANMTLNPAYMGMSGFNESFTGIGMEDGQFLSSWQRTWSFGKGVIGTVGTVTAATGITAAGSSFARSLAESAPGTIGEMLPGVHPDSMIHLTPAAPESFAGGVEGGTYWARLGDVSHMTLEEYQLGVVGPGAPASLGNEVSGFVVSPPGTGSFMWHGSFNPASVMEYTNDTLLQGTLYFHLP